MQFTATLNKVISLFLVGSLAIALVLVLGWRWLLRLVWNGAQDLSCAAGSESLRKAFEIEVRKHKDLETLADHENELRGLAVTLLFNKGTDQHIEWGVQHFAMHIMATDFFLCMVGAGIAAPFADWPLCSLVFFGLSAYVLLSVGLNRFGYAYEVAYRHGCFFLTESRKGGESAGGSAEHARRSPSAALI
jgi:hypothetical protein